MGYPDNYTNRAYDAGPGRMAPPAVVTLAFQAHADNERARVALQAAIDVIERLDHDNFCMAPGYDWRSIVDTLRDAMPQTACAEQVRKLDEWAADRCGECV